VADEGGDDMAENVIPMHSFKRGGKGFKANELEIGRLLREHPELGMGKMFREDTFTGQTLMLMPIPRPWAPQAKRKFEVHEAGSNDITRLIEWLIAHGALKGEVSQSKVNNAIQLLADDNQFSSAQAALDRLPAWDGVYRLDGFFTKVCNAVVAEEGMSEEEIFNRQRYLTALARCFFISIVARILRPGCKVDTVIILEGPQGSLKSTLLKILAFDGKWFSDSMQSDLSNKDAKLHLLGKMIVELAEISQLKTTGVEKLKAFLSASEDTYRKPYGRGEATYLRQCIFVGTTNHDDYLIDETGNRRFWPVKCGRIDIELAREWRDQLFAEAIDAFSKREQWWLSRDIETLAEDEQQQRMVEDVWEQKAIDLIHEARSNPFKGGSWVTIKELLDAVMPNSDNREERLQKRAGRVLRKHRGSKRQLPRGRKPEGWPLRGFHWEPYQ